jgi:hypothetical protein
MQPTGNPSYGITGIWELVTEALFPVVAYGQFVIDTNKSGLWFAQKGGRVEKRDLLGSL